MFGNADELFKFIKDEGVEFIDVRFTDLPGIQQHFSVPISSFDQGAYDNGLAFDGSSVRGFQSIDQSDMQLLPDPTTAYVDPFRTHKTLAMDFYVHDPITGEAYSRDPRNIARKAEAYLATTGIGDTAYFAPEAEFYIFDRVSYATSEAESYYQIESTAGAWNTGADSQDNRGYKVRYKGGYFPVTPTDHFADLRGEMMTKLEAVGLTVERGHHEVGTAGQAEINYNFNSLRAAADDMMKFKYIIRTRRGPTTRLSRSCPSRSSATTVPACTATSPSGTTASRCSTTRPATAACPTPRATTSAACSSTRRRCSPSRTRR